MRWTKKCNLTGLFFNGSPLHRTRRSDVQHQPNGETVMPSRIPMLTNDESARRTTTLGLEPKWGRLNLSRILLHQPAVATVLADILALLLKPAAALDQHLHALIILRTAWVSGAGLEWMQYLRTLLGLDLPEADMLSVTNWRSSDRLSQPACAVLAAVDDVLAGGRISDTTWNAWNVGRPTIEATIEMVVAVGVWRMASEQLLSLDIPIDEDAARVSQGEHRQPPTRPTTRFDGSASAVDRISPMGLAEAESLCRQHNMSLALARSAVWTRLLRHPPIAAALSRQLYHLLQSGTLSARLREFIIMRIGWVTGTAYEWTRHWPHSMKAGISSDELVALRDWRNGNFNTAERAVLAATDETMSQGRVSATTWAECRAVLEPAFLIELVAVIGTWHLFSQLMRSLAIPLEADAEYWQPDGKGPFS